jgi:UDP-4-amino-4,6-dideoxy-N-acetyl-beta-L-altrosamine transaminase
VIPYGRQDVTADDIAAVVEVLGGDWLTQGPAIDRFESALAAYCGAAHGVAFCNATAALHIACLALGVGPGDTLWTSPNTFLASANCALYCGAAVDFVDIDTRSYNLCPQALETKLRQAKIDGKLPKVVVPVHFAGQSCDMAAIRRLADEYGFAIIEDASHAVGARYLGAPVGNCRYSDITIFSFHPVKIITTGEGGMAMTGNAALAGKLRLLRSHGMTRDAALMSGASEGPWYYQQVDLGYNYRITDLQAALGNSQLARLDAFVERRHQLAARYDVLLRELPVVLPWQHPDTHSSYHLYPIQVEARSGKTRRQVFEALREAGIGVNVHYIPVHTQPYYAQFGFGAGQFPAAEHYYAGAISLPMFSSLTDADQDVVVQALKNALR